MVYALPLRMCTNDVDFRVMRRRRKWNWQWNWQSVNQHSCRDPRQRTTWSRRETSDFNSVFLQFWTSFIKLTFNMVTLIFMLRAIAMATDGIFEYDWLWIIVAIVSCYWQWGHCGWLLFMKQGSCYGLISYNYVTIIFHVWDLKQ